MNILFRVDGGSAMGMGHLMRCLALAQALEKAKLSCYFAIQKTSLKLCQSREDWCGQILLLPESQSVDAELSDLQLIIGDKHIDALVLDGYQFKQAYRQGLTALSCPLILFDDNNDSGELYADLVINGAENAASLGYQKTAGGAHYCLGSAYRVLRQEFIHSPSKNWQERDKLTLCMGGSDPKQLSLPLLKTLLEHDFTGPICLITGDAYPELVQLQDFIKQCPINVQHIHNCQSIAEVFSQSRLVVSAAGGSQFELLACLSPSILLVIADNQLNASEQAVKQGWCEMLDLRTETSAKHGLEHSAEYALEHRLRPLVSHIMQLWSQEQTLIKMHHLAQQHSDTQGAERLVSAILNLCQGQIAQESE